MKKTLLVLAFAFALAGASEASAAYMFNTNLTVGSSGADVIALQDMLVAGGYLPASTFATVSKGNFGPLTQSAVAKWQMSVGISPAAGYFGPISRAKANMSVVVTTPTTPTAPTTSTGLNGGEASLEDFDASSGDDSDVEEGDSAEVAEFEFDVEDGDVEIDRVDVSFQGLTTEEDPWDTFETVTLIINGEEIDEIDASDEDEWSDEENELEASGSDDDYSLRFTNVDTKVEEGETATIVVAVTVANTVDNLSATWEVGLGDDGVRATDGLGIDNYIGDDTDTVSFDVEEAGQDEELSVSEGDDSPDATTLKVENDSTSEWFTLLTFDLEAEESDITVNEFPVTFTLSSTTLDIADVLDDAELVIDGETYDDYDAFSTTADSATTTFDLDDDLTIEADDTVSGEVRVRFTAISNYEAGVTVTASISSSNVDGIEAEGEDDLDRDALTGSATGEAMTLREEGISVEAPSVKTVAVATNDADSATDDEGVFTFEFDVTAFEEASFIKLNATLGTTTSPTYGVNFVIEDSNGVAATSTTGAVSATVELIENGDENGGYAEVEDGETATFRVIVNFNPAHTTGTGVSYRVRLDSVNFNDTQAAPDSRSVLSPAQDYRTAYKQVQN